MKGCWNCKRLLILTDEEGQKFTNCIDNKEGFKNNNRKSKTCEFYKFTVRVGKEVLGVDECAL